MFEKKTSNPVTETGVSSSNVKVTLPQSTSGMVTTIQFKTFSGETFKNQFSAQDKLQVCHDFVASVRTNFCLVATLLM